MSFLSPIIYTLNAFAECTRLTDIELGTLTEIGDYSFFKTAIKDHPSFDAIKVIGAYAFSGAKLTSVSIPDGVTVSEGAF